MITNDITRRRNSFIFLPQNGNWMFLQDSNFETESLSREVIYCLNKQHLEITSFSSTQLYKVEICQRLHLYAKLTRHTSQGSYYEFLLCKNFWVMNFSPPAIDM